MGPKAGLAVLEKTETLGPEGNGRAVPWLSIPMTNNLDGLRYAGPVFWPAHTYLHFIF